ncbi:MAG TPA: hypothetical protein V6D15_16205 [Oculatellaceae cyanobacterium]|jgi:hypothetical protein
MFEIINQFSEKSQYILETQAQNLVKEMQLDVSSYAPNRYRLWLFHEANLKNPPTTTEAVFNEFWWQVAQRVYPGSSIALLTFGGEAGNIKSDARIGWHRDHTFAMPIAKAINFGGNAEFGYDFNRQGGNKKIIKLAPGSVFHFDCKHLHAVLNHDPNRFSLILWKIRQDSRYPELKICDRISKLLA